MNSAVRLADFLHDQALELEDVYRAGTGQGRSQVGAGHPTRRCAEDQGDGRSDGPAGEEGEGWAVRLNGVDELLAVSRRQLAAVRELVSR